MTSRILNWFRQRKIDQLMIERAGLLEEKKIMMLYGTIYPVLINRLGSVEEHLRQLGKDLTKR